jgi:hypothetical protein
LQGRIARLENGLEKLKTTAIQVEQLKVVLAEQEIELGVRNIAADKLIQVRIAFLYLSLTYHFAHQGSSAFTEMRCLSQQLQNPQENPSLCQLNKLISLCVKILQYNKYMIINLTCSKF